MFHLTEVFDQRSAPAPRVRFGSLLANSVRADFAVRRIRLLGIDLTIAESRIQRCRVLVGGLDAAALGADTDTALRPEVRRNLDVIHEMLLTGRLAVRSAGLQDWMPDFSLYVPRTRRTTCAIGAHYLGRAPVAEGPVLTCITRSPATVALLSTWFDQLWENGYDASAAVREAVERLV